MSREYGWRKREDVPGRLTEIPATSTPRNAFPRTVAETVKGGGGGAGLVGDGTESPDFVDVTADSITVDTAVIGATTQTVPAAVPSAPASGATFYIDPDTGLPSLIFSNGLIRRVTVSSPYESGNDPVPPETYLGHADSGVIASTTSTPPNTFADAHSASGDAVGVVDGTDLSPNVVYEDGPPVEWSIQRAAVCFDCSAIGGTPKAGRVSLKSLSLGDAAYAGALGDLAVRLLVFTKDAPNDPLATGDWGDMVAGVVASDNEFTYADLDIPVVTVTYHLNAAGLAHVAAGRVWFALVINYDHENVDPAFGTEKSFGPYFGGADQVSDDDKPRLYLEFD